VDQPGNLERAFEGEESPPKSSLVRALSVVNVIAERAPETLGVSTIARTLGLPKAVAHRILKELVANDFLAFDDGSKRYRLGPGALSVGLAALRALDVPAVAHRYLVRLVEQTSETATLSVRQGASRVYIDQVLSPQEIRMSVSLGTSHPLHAGSSSKAILAALSDAEIDEYIAEHGLDPVTDATITSEALLRKEIAQIRRQGYAVSMGERQSGAGSVAAAVRMANGQVFGSISLCGPQDRFTAPVRAARGALVARTARELSLEIGYRPPPQTATAHPGERTAAPASGTRGAGHGG
jgi:IclR family transcriptional regulator, acetate operon repressor